MDYDIIGDVHGYAQALEALLAHLGFKPINGVWRHPTRKAIFVGDFIDRGPLQLETVALVRAMVEAGSALAVMGNHEFNAIAWHTPDPLCAGEYLRPRSGAIGERNRLQHAKFLEAISDPRSGDDVIDWFLTLPLWLDLPDLRVVHACWHEQAMAELEPLLAPDRQLTRELVERASRPGRMEFRAVEAITKGVEVPLPKGYTFLDKDGHERANVRIRWWDNQATRYPLLALSPDDDSRRLPDLPVPVGTRVGYDSKKPVFFGHYWLTGQPAPLGDSVVCVDYSVAKGGRLVAYRFAAGEPVSSSNFTWVGA